MAINKTNNASRRARVQKQINKQIESLNNEARRNIEIANKLK